ncbi:LysR substrate-binding domain-containing protein [Bordetella genomosp. 9]|uniref:LysR family transcriptional regulator n=1 Tax=Bordetella genomosp. 9 TaxID=1416803 RepID=A0A1W6Z3Y7_9BORD|nr:LysR substrate-binding domain-containing protein [Bordetella genomosp. 9]ARP88072.1 LysR family transcriptional regulator [Bordetella genomosp. 9]ARP92036.1 LysR family transcriptional regulator [Bordetella genomosp. 9]
MLTEFRTFVAVARDGTFTGAGRQLGLTQSAVSAQIRRLEEFLGVSLFDRTGRAAALNDTGREMLAQAEEVLAMVDRMAAQAGPGHVTGSLRMGAIASVQQDLMVTALRGFRAEFPDVSVRIVPGVSLSLLGQVDSGEIDLAVLIRPPFKLPPELAWRPLLAEPMVLAAPASLAGLSWRDALTTQPFIRYERASFGGRLVDAFLRRHRIAVHEAVELDEIDAIANLVRAGLGVALMPRTRQLNTAGLRLLDLGAAGFDREIGVAIRRSADPAGVAARMAGCLHEAAAIRSAGSESSPGGRTATS